MPKSQWNSIHVGGCLLEHRCCFEVATRPIRVPIQTVGMRVDVRKDIPRSPAPGVICDRNRVPTARGRLDLRATDACSGWQGPGETRNGHACEKIERDDVNGDDGVTPRSVRKVQKKRSLGRYM